jgi:hypothetical protein
MIYDQHDDRSDDGDEHAVKVEPCYPNVADQAKQPAADDRADDPKHYIKNKALSLLIHDLAGNEAGDETQDYPADDRHARFSLVGSINLDHSLMAVRYRLGTAEF